MAKMPSATWYSIFGQIEEVVAQEMIQEGKVRRLPSDMPGMPNEFNKDGQRLRLLVSVPRQFIGEFERRVAELYL